MEVGVVEVGDGDAGGWRGHVRVASKPTRSEGKEHCARTRDERHEENRTADEEADENEDNKFRELLPELFTLRSMTMPGRKEISMDRTSQLVYSLPLDEPFPLGKKDIFEGIRRPKITLDSSFGIRTTSAHSPWA